MPTTDTRPGARVCLGTATGDDYGYKRPVTIYARVELRRQSSFGTDPREQELPADIIADAVALGAPVPPDRTDPAVILAEGATDGR